MADSTPSTDDESLAALLGPALKPARGPAPKLSHIRAALLMARDAQLESREACRRVDGVPEGAHARVAALAPRVRELLRQWTGASDVDMAATTDAPPIGNAAPSPYGIAIALVSMQAAPAGACNARCVPSMHAGHPHAACTDGVGLQNRTDQSGMLYPAAVPICPALQAHPQGYTPPFPSAGQCASAVPPARPPIPRRPPPITRLRILAERDTAYAERDTALAERDRLKAQLEALKSLDSAREAEQKAELDREQQGLPHPWRATRSQTTGRVFFFNGDESRWTRPPTVPSCFDG